MSWFCYKLYWTIILLVSTVESQWQPSTFLVYSVLCCGWDYTVKPFCRVRCENLRFCKVEINLVLPKMKFVSTFFLELCCKATYDWRLFFWFWRRFEQIYSFIATDLGSIWKHTNDQKFEKPALSLYCVKSITGLSGFFFCFVQSELLTLRIKRLATFAWLGRFSWLKKSKSNKF